MSLTYVQLQNAVIKNAFDEGDRSDVKNWIQGRHAWLWGAEDWTFRQATTTVTFTANSQTVGGLPSDFHIALALYDANGSPITPVKDFRSFFDVYNQNAGLSSGTPAAFTAVASTLMVGPKGDGSSGFLVYEKSKPALSVDGDTTGLPDGYDLALVHGAKAEGFKLMTVPQLAVSADEDFTAYYNALKRDYLTAIRTAGQQWGAYRPAAWS